MLLEQECLLGCRFREFLQNSLTKADWKSLGAAAATRASIKGPVLALCLKAKQERRALPIAQFGLRNLPGNQGAGKWGGGEGTIVLSEGKQGLYPEKLV